MTVEAKTHALCLGKNEAMPGDETAHDGPSTTLPCAAAPSRASRLPYVRYLEMAIDRI
jgi:hypothetical protein